MSILKNTQTAWDLTPLFKNDSDDRIPKSREEVEKNSYQFINKWKDRDDYLRDVLILKQALAEYERWSRNFGIHGKEGYYWRLRSAQDQTNPAIKAKINQITDFATRIQNDIQFFEIRLAKIPIEKQQEFLEANELQVYKHWLERLFAEAKYLLSEPEEKIINLKSPMAFSNWVKMTKEFLSKEERIVWSEANKKKKQSFNQILNLMNSQQKPVRDDAVKAFNQILVKNVDVAEAELNTILQDKKV